MESGVKFLRSKEFDFEENCSEIFVEVKKIKKHDVFYECEKGINYRLVALTNARKMGDGWYCVVENSKGSKVEIFVSEYTKHHGPNLFWEPRFLTEVKNELLYIVE